MPEKPDCIGSVEQFLQQVADTLQDQGFHPDAINWLVDCVMRETSEEAP